MTDDMYLSSKDLPYFQIKWMGLVQPLKVRLINDVEVDELWYD